MPRKPKTRHGATQPEGERKNGQVLLRLGPEARARLDRLVSDRQSTKSDVVADALAVLEAQRR
jgi:hypothetical protein